ncbi:hypothetical protein VRU48_12515 [Pedobacter sp. KR3-3]|uniref:Uncharacterized protein n=1 Tax=Pedobacter albus TaxID=3113905 RepID=A0ABU7I982_9SPHI|nr:hypothetical protein [Pedobacter sp. KR3-3]MEE1945936.1 hypothetical protein [Pedobacter sp. KR3-3]
MEIHDLHFEISNSGNVVRLEPLERIMYNSDLDYDKNWIKTSIIIRGGRFSEQYMAIFLTRDFELLEAGLSKLYDNLKGATSFHDLEGYLKLDILGDGFGHFEVTVKACDEPGFYSSELMFRMEFDQTQIKAMTNQLRRIMDQFPVIGHLG